MGKILLMVKTKIVRQAAKELINQHVSLIRAGDFHYNKLVVDEVAEVNSKCLRNKITGEVTHLLRRMSMGIKINGISNTLQIEQSAQTDSVPKVSELITCPMPQNLAVQLQCNYYGHGKIYQTMDNDREH